jgi:hypothetical protein
LTPFVLSPRGEPLNLSSGWLVIRGFIGRCESSRVAAAETSPGRKPGVRSKTDPTTSLPKAGAQPLAAERRKIFSNVSPAVTGDKAISQHLTEPVVGAGA